MQRATPEEECDLDLGRVRIVFDNESHVDLWFERDVLWTLSASDLKQEAHRIISAVVRDEENVSAETAAVEAAGSKSRSETGKQPGPMTDGPASPTANAVRTVEGSKDTEEVHSSAVRSDGLFRQASPPPKRKGSRFDTEVSRARRREPRVLFRQFPPPGRTGSTDAETPPCSEGGQAQPAHNFTAGRGKSASAASRGVAELSGVSANEAAVAYRARLRMSSVVLHFQGKGLRRGAFLFLAVPEAERAGASCASSSRRSSSSGGDGDRIFRTGRAGGSDVDADVAAVAAAEAAPAGETRTTVHVGGRTELWVTDESVPLLPALSSQWAASAASQVAAVMAAGAAGVEQNSAVSTQSCTDGQPSNTTAPAVTVLGTLAGQLGGGGQKREEQEREDGDLPAAPDSPSPGAGADAGADAAAALTLRMMPSGHSPLPPLCCGVCGCSWEKDGFGRGFRVYHIAVANNASLVWYLHKRFSEFLALHDALTGSGRGEGGEGIPRDRLPEPPTRTFGMLNLFPEKMERFRRGQVEAYLQELLSIPEALANRMVLSFLGLVSSSRHDLMCPSGPDQGGRENSPVAPSPPCTLEPSAAARLPPGMPGTVPAAVGDDASSDAVDTNGDDGCGGGPDEGDRRRGRGNEGESGATAAAPVADRADRDSAGDGSGARACAQAGLVAEEGAAERCRGGGNAAAAAGSQGRYGAQERVLAEAAVVERQQRPEGKKVAAAVAVARKVERVAALERAAQGGDVMLFRCRGLLSRLQRWVLRSEWDHVGVVVSGGPSGRLELLESAKGGVRLYPLVERLRAYHEQGFARRVAWRKLRCANPTEARVRLEAFARQAEGKAYGIVLPFASRVSKEATLGRNSAPPATPHQSPGASPAPPLMPPRATSTTTTADNAAGGNEDGEGGLEGGFGEEGDALGVGVQREEEAKLLKAPGWVEEKTDQPGQEATLAVGDIAKEDATQRHPAAITQPPSPPPPPPPHPSYLCSQLVGAALSEMGVLRKGGEGRAGKGEDARWLLILPGAFGQGGAVERVLAVDASLGEEILVDAHEPEVASAVLLEGCTGDSSRGTQC